MIKLRQTWIVFLFVSISFLSAFGAVSSESEEPSHILPRVEFYQFLSGSFEGPVLLVIDCMSLKIPTIRHAIESIFLANPLHILVIRAEEDVNGASPKSIVRIPASVKTFVVYGESEG